MEEQYTMINTPGSWAPTKELEDFLARVKSRQNWEAQPELISAVKEVEVTLMSRRDNPHRWPTDLRIST